MKTRSIIEKLQDILSGEFLKKKKEKRALKKLLAKIIEKEAALAKKVAGGEDAGKKERLSAKLAIVRTQKDKCEAALAAGESKAKSSVEKKKTAPGKEKKEASDPGGKTKTGKGKLKKKDEAQES